jgi:hypothetical protein
MKNLEILEFRKININDPYDDHYNDGEAWSRVYEYPIVINEMKRNMQIEKNTHIHNSSWGWQDVHIRFKMELDALTEKAIHTDIQKSELPKTGIWNITKKPPISYLENFDIVVNISTVEEVDYDHLKVFNNLLSQLKVGGLLICTFDLPGLQLEKFEERFAKKLLTSENDLTGSNSRLQNFKYSNLSCGILVVRKLESTLKKDRNWLTRLFNL